MGALLECARLACRPRALCPRPERRPRRRARARSATAGRRSGRPPRDAAAAARRRTRRSPTRSDPGSTWCARSTRSSISRRRRSSEGAGEPAAARPGHRGARTHARRGPRAARAPVSERQRASDRPGGSCRRAQPRAGTERPDCGRATAVLRHWRRDRDRHHPRHAASLRSAGAAHLLRRAGEARPLSDAFDARRSCADDRGDASACRCPAPTGSCRAAPSPRAIRPPMIM